LPLPGEKCRRLPGGGVEHAKQKNAKQFFARRKARIAARRFA
jgi:hypothetical protein